MGLLAAVLLAALAPIGARAHDCPLRGGEIAYTRHARIKGIPLRCSDRPREGTLEAAAEVLGRLTRRNDVLRSLTGLGLSVSVIAVEESLRDAPEACHFYNQVSHQGRRTIEGRAVGAEPDNPVIIVPEENVLALESDPMGGESFLAHELGHAVLNFGVTEREREAVKAAYRRALACGLWEGSYAGCTFAEYFADGTTIYFHLKRQDARETMYGFGSFRQLAAYDPLLAGILARTYEPRDPEDPYDDVPGWADMQRLGGPSACGIYDRTAQPQGGAWGKISCGRELVPHR